MHRFDISFVRYGLAFMASREAVDEVYTCSTDQLVPVDPATYNQWWQCSPEVIQYTSSGPMKCELACGKELLNYFGVKYSTNWQIGYFGILHAFFAFFLISGYLCIKYINHVK